MKIIYKCPHCGWNFPASKTADGLVPKHKPIAGLVVPLCPGIGQTPRGLSDRRPLWKDLWKDEVVKP